MGVKKKSKRVENGHSKLEVTRKNKKIFVYSSILAIKLFSSIRNKIWICTGNHRVPMHTGFNWDIGVHGDFW
jgi:hypothetical protein